MCTILRLAFASLFVLVVSHGGTARAESPASKAADTTKAGKEVTLTGTMMCAKCSLHEGTKCQNVLKVDEAGKDQLYYLAANDVAKSNHGKVCGGSAKASVTGTVGSEGKKKVITPSAIKYE